MIGGHVSALPERTLREEEVDFACNSEGAVTIDQLINALQIRVAGLFRRWKAWSGGYGDAIRSNLSPALIKDLDKDLHGNIWHLLPMDKYRAHNWQCFEDLSRRKPYASF